MSLSLRRLLLGMEAGSVAEARLGIAHSVEALFTPSKPRQNGLKGGNATRFRSRTNPTHAPCKRGSPFEQGFKAFLIVSLGARFHRPVHWTESERIFARLQNVRRPAATSCADSTNWRSCFSISARRSLATDSTSVLRLRRMSLPATRNRATKTPGATEQTRLV